MGFFASDKSAVRNGVIIDIGSGSVLVAIVSSDENKPTPTIIWSKREHSPLRQINSINDSAKSVMTSLMNAFISLDSEGRKVFHEKTGLQKLSYLQVTIAAPWSYTATKIINYQNNEEFEVTSTLIDELLRTADKKIEEEMMEREKAHDLGLEIISKTTMQISANDYPILLTGKQKANSVKVIEACAVAQEYLTAAIEDAHQKIMAKASVQQYSFMLPFYFVMNDLSENTTECCLVDVTYEATEIGVVRNGVLSYTTHIPYGSFSVAREISEVLKVPLEEAFGYLSEDDMSDFMSQLPAAKKEEVAEVINSYQSKITELFKETGDSLAIPKKLYLHGNLKSEPFFNKSILAAAKAATKMQHAVYNVTSELLTKHYNEKQREDLVNAKQDTALLISAQFFHTREYHSEFEQL